jgi:AcrR family transcriptional regulator
MRGVARDAGVDPALVHYYFASKEALLDASTDPPQAWLDAIGRTTRAPLEQRGETIVRNIIWTWSVPEIAEVLASILMTAVHEERTTEKLRAFLAGTLLPSVAEEIPDDERILRAALVGSQTLGVMMLRYLWRIEPLASLPDDDLVAIVAPTLQRYLSGPLR